MALMLGLFARSQTYARQDEHGRAHERAGDAQAPWPRRAPAW
eukprot:CAMPEP_0183375682 /NCGR_PEP_ID=MMETSP0164_2-20130417/118074_1 /TAXON_ID=221442 /ORGANISM="Coccolithus pelagicus ssp braarudi, Strain PLY182g" /LENGTH=41 /DNA_ID= /DNA_START= /DNA_END= /DNA_ORIENTATION=